MAYAIDLSPRQTTRTLEQAVRYRADILLVPRVQRDEEPIVCSLECVGKPEAGRASRAYLVIIPTVETEPAGTPARSATRTARTRSSLRSRTQTLGSAESVSTARDHASRPHVRRRADSGPTDPLRLPNSNPPRRLSSARGAPDPSMLRTCPLVIAGIGLAPLLAQPKLVSTPRALPPEPVASMR